MTKPIKINPWGKSSKSAGKDLIRTPQGYWTESPASLRGAKNP